MNKAQIQMKKARQKGLSPLEMAQMKAIAKKHAEAMEQEANERALLQLLAIPCLILGEDYWKKSAKQRIPKFIEGVASMYESYKLGIVTDKDLSDALKDMAGITIEAEWMKNEPVLCETCAHKGKCAIYDNFNIKFCSDWSGKNGRC